MRNTIQNIALFEWTLLSVTMLYNVYCRITSNSIFTNNEQHNSTDVENMVDWTFSGYLPYDTTKYFLNEQYVF